MFEKILAPNIQEPFYDGSLERTSSDYDVFHPRDPNKGSSKNHLKILESNIEDHACPSGSMKRI